MDEVKKVHCTKYFRLMQATRGDLVTISAMRMRCKSWACETCARQKAYKIGKRCETHFDANETRFMTLTIKPMSDRVEALKLVKASWNRLRLMIQRKWGKFRYCWTLEAQPNTGMPHLHILLDKYIAKAWLNVKAVRAGFGPICDIRKVKNNAVLRYVVKYTTKGLGDQKLEQALQSIRGRRVGFSRGMSLDEPEKIKWVSIGVAQIDREAKEIEQQMALAVARAGGDVNKVESGTNYIGVSFYAPDAHQTTQHISEQWHEAEKYRAKMYREASLSNRRVRHWRFEDSARPLPIETAWHEFQKENPIC